MSKEKEQVRAQYAYIKQLADRTYEAELQKESNLIQQSSQMQTAFSFITGAVFMAVPICIEYRGTISLAFYMWTVSAITVCILISLVLATAAQWRWKTETFPDIDVLKASVLDSDDWETLSTETGQLAQEIDLLSKVQKEKARLNDRRVKLIMESMIFFWISIACILISFIAAMVITFGR